MVAGSNPAAPTNPPAQIDTQASYASFPDGGTIIGPVLGGCDAARRGCDLLEPKDVVWRYLEHALGADNPELLEELVESEDLKDGVRRFRRAFPDLTIRVDRLIAEGGIVAAYLTGTGTSSGPWINAAGTEYRPTSTAFEADCVAMYQVDDGRIVDFWLNWDWIEIFGATGRLTLR